ncbi:hypothetical protein [uncultured Alistipes sp.]|jgi:hypothetical protein|uniref:hypothetical protein n=1 Tax=uncultured Alistipes sp. TaxID=538949 RepID=UPI0025CC3891|nr:hypothetical protein [uncultured Alistipes sp.]
MKIFPLLFNRIVFVRVELLPDGSCSSSVYQLQRGKLDPAAWDAAKGALAALVVCGQGVVTKPDDADITARVKADPETFLWSSADGRTSFVRRERLKAVEGELAAQNLFPVRIFCTDAAADLEETAGGFARQLYDGLHWRMLLKPTPESSSVLQVLVRRAGLPVLGLFLLLLAANAMFSPQVVSRRQVLQTELSVRENTATGAAAADTRQRKLLAEFARRPSVPRAVLCDRIARAVPERVVLTLLEVEPLTKRFEANKPLLQRENAVVVCGLAPAAADISTFVQQLAELECCREVQLMNVERERDGSRLLFRIETAL